MKNETVPEDKVHQEEYPNPLRSEFMRLFSLFSAKGGQAFRRQQK